MSDPAVTRNAILFGVTTVDQSSAWAVGSVADSQGRERTLVRRWDGQTWQTQPSPNVRDQTNRLYDVAEVPDGTAWAVGERSRRVAKTIVQRYDGTEWRMQRSLNPSRDLNVLEAVDVAPGGDVYAVGSRWNAKRRYRTMIQRYDGSAWELVPSRYPGLFHDVDVVSDTDVWSVGVQVVDRVGRALVVRYDGETWTKVTLPDVGDGFNVLNGVSAAAPDDVWAVGYYREGTSYRALILHYDGAAWSVAEIPDLGPDVELYDVSAVDADTAVAVGQRTNYDFGEDSRVVLEWDGSTWTEAARDDDLQSNWLFAVDVAPDGAAWTVGYHSARPQTSYVARRTCT